MAIQGISSKSPALNVLVVGTGMYVCGRDTDGFGTILPALYEWKRREKLGDVYIAGAHPEGLKVARDKIRELNQLTGIAMAPKFFPEDNRYNPFSYRDAIRMIPRPACAVIAVPDNLHREVAGSAIEEGMHTLVVKPLAPTVKEALELIALQDRKQVYCAVEFHKRFDRSNLKLKDAIAQGTVGIPLYFVVEYSQRKSVPSEHFKSWVDTTNVFQYLGVHYVDIIYFVTGAKPKRVMAVGQKNWLLSMGVNAYDSVEALIDWVMPSGGTFTSVLTTSWVDPETTSAMSDQKIKVVGTKGRYEADQKRRGVFLVADQRGIEEPNPDFCTAYGSCRGEVSFRGYGIDSVSEFLGDVSLVVMGLMKKESLEGKRPTFRDSVVSTSVIEAVKQSLESNNGWIPVMPEQGSRTLSQ